MNWRAFLLNRYIVTFGSVAAVALAWNLYIAMNDDGIIRGRVVDADGHLVAGATVVLSERTLLVTAPRDRVTTDADGRFTFTGHRFHRIWLEAGKRGVGTYQQTEYRMYFKGQNIVVKNPLQLAPPAGGQPGKPS
ncbi:carboxypeptidase-like regulatory domain-containing protein [Shumkonia mesophila]|uniref:carboxypeptidase-like regulatory domain-containing protein n=1 Tax=Shumkonia mesophila TaxID=2838854 RepID=UPI0029343E64|nr:carboxypeptidase-like regulatory domain-containing protein [Shumkonia mesophila]